jgi:hypothetical protein
MNIHQNIVTYLEHACSTFYEYTDENEFVVLPERLTIQMLEKD